MTMGFGHHIKQFLRRRTILKEVARIKAMTVGQIMTKYIITIRAEDEVIKAATKMVAEDISCLVVADGDKPIGIISERDFLRKVPLSKAVFTMKVKDIMTPDPVTVPPSMPLTEAVALMKSKGFRRLIVAEHGKMLGVVTQTNFTRTLSELFVSYPLASGLLAKDIMTTKILTVSPKNTVAEGKQKMLKADVGAIIIMDKDQPVGIFTEYDILMQFYDQHGKLEMSDIGKYMRKYVRAVPPDASLFAANRLMLEKNMRRLLIVDGTKAAGIITQTDICRYMYSAFDTVLKTAQDSKTDLKRFSLNAEIHGEFHGDHLKVYDVE